MAFPLPLSGSPFPSLSATSLTASHFSDLTSTLGFCPAKHPVTSSVFSLLGRTILRSSVDSASNLSDFPPSLSSDNAPGYRPVMSVCTSEEAVTEPCRRYTRPSIFSSRRRCVMSPCRLQRCSGNKFRIKKISERSHGVMGSVVTGNKVKNLSNAHKIYGSLQNPISAFHPRS